MSVQRYRFVKGMPTSGMVPTSQEVGEWVKYSDHVAELARARAEALRQAHDAVKAVPHGSRGLLKTVLRANALAAITALGQPERWAAGPMTEAIKDMLDGDA